MPGLTHLTTAFTLVYVGITLGTHHSPGVDECTTMLTHDTSSRDACVTWKDLLWRLHPAWRTAQLWQVILARSSLLALPSQICCERQVPAHSREVDAMLSHPAV